MPTWIVVVLAWLAVTALLTVALARRWIGAGDRDESFFEPTGIPAQNISEQVIVIRRAEQKAAEDDAAPDGGGR